MQRVRAATFTVGSEGACPFEVEGELAGHLPATFGIRRATLRVLVP